MENLDGLSLAQVSQRLRHVKQRLVAHPESREVLEKEIAALESRKAAIMLEREEEAAKALEEKQEQRQKKQGQTRKERKEEREELKRQTEELLRLEAEHQAAMERMKAEQKAALKRVEEERAQKQAREEEEARARAQKNAIREKRKAERAAEQEKRAQEAEALKQKIYEQQKREEERREAIRQQKKEEEQKKREKREREQKAERERREREEKAERERREREQKAELEKLLAGPQTFERLDGSVHTEEDDDDHGDGIQKLSDYRYFYPRQIFQSMKFSQGVVKKARRLLENGTVGRVDIGSGYSRISGDGGIVGDVSWAGGDRNWPIEVAISFSRTKVLRSSCDCNVCTKARRRSSWYYEENSSCEYVAAVLMVLQNFMESHNFGDATDKRALDFLELYRDRSRQLKKQEEGEVKEASVILRPRLIKKNGKLEASFKIGMDKLLLIKRLDDFCEHVRNGSTAPYGANLTVCHRRENFTEEGKRWRKFIERIVQEEEEFSQRLENVMCRHYYYGARTAKVGGSLNLFGWRLDSFYETLGKDMVEYEDRDGAYTNKLRLVCDVGNPQVRMRIEELKLDEKKTDESFHGVNVSGTMPELFFGMEKTYFVREKPAALCRSDRDFQGRIEPLNGFLTPTGEFSFQIGRNQLGSFYHQVLPSLEDIVEVSEENPEKFRSFLPPKVSFSFYFDAREDDIFCEPFAIYGKEARFPLLDRYDDEKTQQMADYRDEYEEDAVFYKVQDWMPFRTEEGRELCCGGEENLIMKVMTEGIRQLQDYGEVYCTPRFRARRRIKNVKVSVGVSVSNGLLDLEIASEEVPMNELLDLLESYRKKQKFYRLKDGSYVDLDDESLAMLSELMDSMRVKPKEFVRGKMHLPLYRTLYLNKMLEENESVYSERDSHFRGLVKEFKTVNDADFDVPTGLSKVMRQYQKDGYRWMRLLEAWKFGGILADDMGLGKTLQMISVLLAAKERGELGTALVVCPASLVFNWSEEFARFAPELTVTTIAGALAARQEKIDDHEDYDVLITSYDLLKRDIASYEDITFSYEVIDEAQYIKNHTTAAAKAVKVIKASQRFALTGTPIENRLSELWSIFDYLMPGFLYGYDVFKRELETPIAKYQDENAMARLQKMTAPFILRRLKENVLKDLPDKLEEVRYVRFSEKQQKLYDAQVLRMRESLSKQDAQDFNQNKLAILAELTHLRQICCDPSLLFENYDGESAKAQACLELIQSAIDGGHRMLIFSQFTSMLDILQSHLTAAGIAFYTIIGGTSKEKRLQLVKEFNAGDVPVFLISLKAGGVGLNLTGADVVIHYDPWWNIAATNQATDRAHRIGQEKKVTVYKLIAKQTVEEKILKLQETKRDLADSVIGGETGGLGGMSREDMLELLEG